MPPVTSSISPDVTGASVIGAPTLLHVGRWLLSSSHCVVSRLLVDDTTYESSHMHSCPRRQLHTLFGFALAVTRTLH